MSDLPLWEIEPGRFPRAPSREEWAALSPAERARCVAELPGEVTYEEMSMPEGDFHAAAKERVVQSLRRYFKHGGAKGRNVYVGSELPVYYPASPRFAPDLLVVFDVPDHPRNKFVVSAEGKGLDFVLEVHYGGDRKRDCAFKVALYAKVGIPEYFIYDRARQRLLGYRLPDDGGAYKPILAQAGQYESRVLGVTFAIEEDNVRLYLGEAALPDDREYVARIEMLVRQTGEQVEEEARRAEEEQTRRAAAEARADLEARLRSEAEARLQELQARLERLEKKG